MTLSKKININVFVGAGCSKTLRCTPTESHAIQQSAQPAHCSILTTMYTYYTYETWKPSNKHSVYSTLLMSKSDNTDEIIRLNE